MPEDTSAPLSEQPPATISDDELAKARRKFLELTARRKKDIPHGRLYPLIGGPLDGADTSWTHRSSPASGHLIGWVYRTGLEHHDGQLVARNAFDEAAGVFRFRDSGGVKR